MGIQIFVSYARDDDALPGGMGPSAKGFVTNLLDELVYEFSQIGPVATRPKLWRDIDRVEKGEDFSETFPEQLAASDLILIILSRNWLDRPWCRRELDLFASKKLEHESEQYVKQRIVFAAKHDIGYSLRPPLIQNKEGYSFYALDGDDADGIGREKEFFDRGREQDSRYLPRVKELARYLYRSARKYANPEAVADHPTEATPPPAKQRKANRTIYVAQPAADMRDAYARVVAELTGRHFNVVPAPSSSEIPKDESATAYVDDALQEADLSVHLLGEKPGYAPDDAPPITSLQLIRAATRVGEKTANSGDGFFRMIWAPKKFAWKGTETFREPLDVLARWDRQTDTDKIEGDTLSRFIEFLIQRIDRTASPQHEPMPFHSDTRVYINHRIEDYENATEFGKALAQRKIAVTFPTFEGDPAGVKNWHREKLREADAVLLCWAKAPDLWISQSAQELRSWRELGREQRFTCRLLVAAPPPGQTKRRLLDVPPRTDIDAVVDLTACETPPADAFDSLFRAADPQ